MSSRSDETSPLLTFRSRSGQELGSNGRMRRATLALPMVVATYFLAYMVTVIIMNPFIYDRIAKEYDYTYNSSSEKPCVKDEGNTTDNATAREIQEEIQRRVATTELYLIMTNYLLAAVPVLILGPLTDRYGRKIGFLLPIVGTLLKQIVYIVVIATKQPVFVLFIGHTLEALGGSFAAMLGSMFSVISDVTEPGNQRSFRITVMEAMWTLIASLGMLIVAQWIRVSYVYPLAYGIGMSVASFLLAVFCLPNTNSAAVGAASILDHGTLYTSRVSCVCQRVARFLSAVLQLVKRNFFLYIKDDTGQNRMAKRRLCIAAFILTVVVNLSTPNVQNLYLMKYPLCWSATQVYTFGSVQIVCSWFSILIIVTVLQKIFNMPDRHVTVIGVLSSLSEAVFMSVATTDAMVYGAAGIGVMIRAIIPMLRSIISSVVDSTDQGAIYAGMGCLETIGASVFAAVANRLYYTTLASFAGAVFLMFASLMVLALFCLIILNIIYIREKPGPPLQPHERPQPQQNGDAGNIQTESDPSW